MTITDTPTTPPASANRSTLRTVLLVGGSIVIALILLFTTLRIVAAVTRDDNSGSHTVQQSFDKIDLGTTAADVTVRVADVEHAEIVFDQGSSKLQLRYEVRGDTLWLRVGNSWWGWIGDGDWLPWGDRSDVSLTLTIPESSAAALDLDTTAGDVLLDGIFGELTLDTTAGDITLRGEADSLDLDTTAGGVTLDGFSVSGLVRAQTTAGDLTMDLATLPKQINVSSTAGDVRLSLPDGSYRIDASSTAGTVDSSVSSDASSDREYRIRTTAGDIDIRLR